MFICNPRLWLCVRDELTSKLRMLFKCYLFTFRICVYVLPTGVYVHRRHAEPMEVRRVHWNPETGVPEGCGRHGDDEN